MKLYDFPVAPNPRKLRTYLAEKGIDLEIVQIDIVRGAAREPEFLKRNPMAALPVLELDDGSCLTESLAIIEYMEELHPQPPMIGTQPLVRARTREMERFIETSIMNRIARIAFHSSKAFSNREQIARVAEVEIEALEKPLNILAEKMQGSQFVCGDTVTIADCTLHAALSFAQFTKIAVQIDQHAIIEWWEGFRQRPSASA